jgi:hypothetical protein
MSFTSTEIIQKHECENILKIYGQRKVNVGRKKFIVCKIELQAAFKVR